MKSKNSLETLIIGLDGATFDLMLPFIEKGELPNLGHLLKNGAWGELESTIPPVTAAAWPSFMTGENPGKHGILQFIQGDSIQQSNKLQQQTVTSKNFASRTFFDVMKMNGKRVGAITIPVTYPPWDINGVMVSGFPCPDNNKIYSVSRDISFNISKPLNFEAEYYKTASEEQILEDCLYRDKLRSGLTFDLLQRYEFESFTVIFGGIDRACHDYWKYHDPDFPGITEDQRRKFKYAIIRNYKLADEEIGRFLTHFGDKANFFIISDHGSGRSPFRAFNVNVWLKKSTFLALKPKKAYLREVLKKGFKLITVTLTPDNRKSTSFLQKLRRSTGNINVLGTSVSAVFDLEKTKAFYYPLMYPVDGIMINLKGRQTKGIVNPGQEKEELEQHIIKGLLEYRDEKTGEKVVEKAFRREEIYSGKFTEQFPDIVYILNKNYMGGNEIIGSEITLVPQFRLSKRSGLHRLNGVFVAYGPKIRPGQIQEARIVDIAPTILYCSELPVPDSMDGTVLKGIFREEEVNYRPVEYFSFGSKQIGNNESLDELENEQMQEKLRSLGYID